ncbi:uncharacterized protein EI90DRAFT_1011016 [Cantharellus anzutake]|uniref:uncharacterized protein n=1 Tax=Cantharellus anzutake TaxID=1750568 RepID=UPI00190640FA|nr:uncharacterized protein EI90DRAFT_1011016 [Cantharellus anzutake]KAF8331338.1 hypothetical protein EI90DRAFT_1011016 [Cantharellus anzutake]
MTVTLSPTVAAVTRFLGWSFFPSFLANAAIVGYHRVFEPHLPRPRPGSPKYAKQYRISFTILAILYLLYTLVAAVTTLPPNYYEILGVNRDIDESGLKTAFRNLARRNHPDRVGPSGEQRFREGRNAYETLKHPVKRFAYERFGPEILSWRGVSTPKEYVRRGIGSASGFHIASAGFLVIMSVFGKSTESAFWRYVLLAAISCAEACLILSPSFSPSSRVHYGLPIISTLMPRRLPYQHVYFLHQMFVSLSVCVTQLGPILFPQHGLEAMSDKDVIRAVGEISQRIALMGNITEREVYRLLQSQLKIIYGAEKPKLSSPTTFDDTDPVMEALTTEMQNLVIESRLRQHPVVRTVWDRVLGTAKKATSVSSIPVAVPATVHSPSDSSPKSVTQIQPLPPPSPAASVAPPISPTFTLRALSVDPGALSDSTAVERISSSPPPRRKKASTLGSNPPPRISLSHSPPRSPKLVKNLNSMPPPTTGNGNGSWFLSQTFLLATENQSKPEGHEEL